MHRCKRCVNISEYQVHDSVAQLDRACDYESKGQGFESLLGHQMKASQQCGAFLFIVFRLVRDVVANHKTTRYAGAATKVIQKNHLA